MSVIWPCLTAREPGKYVPAIFPKRGEFGFWQKNKNKVGGGSHKAPFSTPPSLISIAPDIYCSQSPMHMLYVRLIKPIKAGTESAYSPLYYLQAWHIVGSQ